MKRLKLTVTSQGIRGGNATKTEEKGYGLLTARKDDKEALSLSIDTYEGFGDDYKEREEPIIIINFHDDVNNPFQFTVDQLKKILVANANKLN